MKGNKWFIKFLIAFILWIYILLFFVVYNFFFWENWVMNKKNNESISATTSSIIEKINTWSIYTGTQKPLTTSDFLSWCDVKDANYIDIATPSDRFYTQSGTSTNNVPTKKIQIVWNLWNIFLCIIPDISDKKEKYNEYRKGYNTVTHIKVWKYVWALDVGYSLNNKQFYDSDSDNSSVIRDKMYGKYWTHELPYTQIVDLQKNVIFADTQNWWTTKIDIKDQFLDWSEILIGWYMTKLWADDYRASSIKNFRILRNWDGHIELIK